MMRDICLIGIGVFAALLCVSIFIVPKFRNMQKKLAGLEKLVSVVECCPLSVVLESSHGEFLYANEATRTILNSSNDSALHIESILSQEDLTGFHEKTRQDTCKSGIWNRITVLSDCNAKKTDVFQCIFLVTDADGTNENVCIITRPVYEEKKLREIVDIQSAIADSSDNFIVALNRSFEIIYSNSGAYRMCGYSREEIGLNITPELIHGKETARKIRHTIQAAFNGVYEQEQSVLICKDGKKLDVEYQIFPIKDKEDFIFGAGVILRDITQRKQDEKQLLRMSALVNSAPQYIAYVNGRGEFDFCNHATYDVTGYTFEELRAGGIQILYSEEINQYINGDILPSIFNMGKYDFELPLIRKDGEVRIMSFSGFRLDGDDYGCGTIASDITDKKNLENELIKAKETAEAANKAKSQFLSNMSHEIRTPMNAVIGMSELLMAENLNVRQKKYVSDINTSANSLLTIINEILDFSRIEAGKLQLSPVSYNLHELLYNLESMFTLVANQKGLEFIMEMDEHLPRYVFGDDVRLRQIFINSLGNAIKFTRAGYVKLNAWHQDDRLFFDISDTGIGIKQEELPKIFNHFERLSANNIREMSGTGLGLPITKSLVDMMDGNIIIESVYGKGTVFHIEIPFIPGNEADIEDTVEEDVYISAPQAKLLVVDDNEINLNVAKGLFSLFDIDCDTALSGKIAIEKIAAAKYDIVFMDHMMPEMDGVEVTKILRNRYGKEELVIIALTANAVGGVRDMLISVGMNDYLSKPIKKHLLSRTLYKWLPKEKIVRKNMLESGAFDKKESAFITLIRENCEEIEVSLALSRVNGMEDVFEQSLVIMARRLPDVCGKLSKFLEEGDLRGFCIEVHGAKGSLSNIGAMKLAKLAEALEMKSKGNDGDFCRAHLPDFIKQLGLLHQKLEPIVNAGKGVSANKSGSDRNELSAKLSTVKQLLNSFECDDAGEMVTGLIQYDYGESVNRQLQELFRMITEFRYDRAIEIIDSFNGFEIQNVGDRK